MGRNKLILVMLLAVAPCFGQEFSSQTPHNVLSSRHPDTTPGTVTRGDLITGQGASAHWARLGKGGASQCLEMDASGVDIVWAACGGGGGGTGTVTNTAGALTAGQLVIGNGGADITVGNLSGDATTAGGTATTVVKVNGVAYPASPSTDTVPVVTAANTATYTAVPNCLDTNGQHLNYNTSTHTFSCGTSIELGCATNGASASTSLGSVSVPSGIKLIHGEMYISGYASSGDTACLRFNGAAGTAYRAKWLVATAASTTFSAGANTLTSTSCIKAGSDNVTTSRNVSFWIVNDPSNTEKLVDFSPGGSGTGSAGTNASLTLGNGAWVSGASTAITSVSVVTLTNNMNAGSGFCLTGMSF